jgi:hypothetical protein
LGVSVTLLGYFKRCRRRSLVSAREAAQRRIAADFAEASVIGGMAQQRGHQGDAPKDGDREIIATAPPRMPEPL